MYFADLSQYQYGRVQPQEHILNVGWLSKDRPFTKGTMSELLLHRLGQLVQSPVNLHRGSHRCEFCPDPPVTIASNGLSMTSPPQDTLGNGEIRLQAADGTIFVAPSLIYHYVVAHGYLPPERFIEAVEDGVPVAFEDT